MYSYKYRALSLNPSPFPHFEKNPIFIYTSPRRYSCSSEFTPFFSSLYTSWMHFFSSRRRIDKSISSSLRDHNSSLGRFYHSPFELTDANSYSSEIYAMRSFLEPYWCSSKASRACFMYLSSSNKGAFSCISFDTINFG